MDTQTQSNSRLNASCYSSILDMYQSEDDILECKTCQTLRLKNKIIQERFDEANSAATKYKLLLSQAMTVGKEKVDPIKTFTI